MPTCWGGCCWEMTNVQCVECINAKTIKRVTVVSHDAVIIPKQEELPEPVWCVASLTLTTVGTVENFYHIHVDSFITILSIASELDISLTEPIVAGLTLDAALPPLGDPTPTLQPGLFSLVFC